MRQMRRRWQTGDVFAPRDLSPKEMDKYRSRKAPTNDIIDALGINPLDNYRVREKENPYRVEDGRREGGIAREKSKKKRGK